MLLNISQIYLLLDYVLGNKEKASLSYKDFAKDVKKGDKVLVDDGKLIFEVISSDKKYEVKLRNIQGGKLSSNKGVNLPNTKISTRGNNF